VSKYFENAARFWLGLQNDFDIEKARMAKTAEMNEREQFAKNIA